MRNPFKSSPVKAYWWNEVPNFGDGLAPLLLKRFAHLDTVWGSVSHSKIVSVGSVLEHVPPLWDGVILGSGRLIENSRSHLVQMRSGVSATILGIRGPLSARGIPGSFAIGDPGLLADELIGSHNVAHQKTWDLGIIPHFSDTELVPRFRALIPKEFSIRVIHPSSDALTVIKEISQCRRVVTSSLHGMIVADSLGIPRRLEYSNRMDKDGGDFKFRDYSASIQTPFETGKMMEPKNRNVVEDVKFEIYDAYRSLESYFKP